MNNFFKVLSKPAKWILVIGSLIYAIWFAVQTAGSIQGSFMSVATHIIILIVGSALLFSVPILVLIKKIDIAKVVFLILAGYWLINTTRAMLGYAERYCFDGADGVSIVGGIFAFITGLCLVGVLSFIVLEFAAKKPSFRMLAFFAMFGVILFGLITGILLFVVLVGDRDYHWTTAANMFVEYLLVPTVVCFGCLFFLGAPKGKGE